MDKERIKAASECIEFILVHEGLNLDKMELMYDNLLAELLDNANDYGFEINDSFFSGVYATAWTIIQGSLELAREEGRDKPFAREFAHMAIQFGFMKWAGKILLED